MAKVAAKETAKAGKTHATTKNSIYRHRISGDGFHQADERLNFALESADEDRSEAANSLVWQVLLLLRKVGANHLQDSPGFSLYFIDWADQYVALKGGTTSVTGIDL